MKKDRIRIIICSSGHFSCFSYSFEETTRDNCFCGKRAKVIIDCQDSQEADKWKDKLAQFKRTVKTVLIPVNPPPEGFVDSNCRPIEVFIPQRVENYDVRSVENYLKAKKSSLIVQRN